MVYGNLEVSAHFSGNRKLHLRSQLVINEILSYSTVSKYDQLETI